MPFVFLTAGIIKFLFKRFVLTEFINLCSELIELRKRGEKPLAYTHSYGCQGNVSDGERINGLLMAMGFDFCEDINDADLILYNTCAIREHAEDRVFGNVGALKHIKRRYPDTIIILCGCMVQQEHAAKRFFEHYPYVDLMFGTHCIHRLPELLYSVLSKGKRLIELSTQDSSVHEDIPIRRDGSIRAWLPIMYGCNNFCSYCVVPYVRGRERSRAIENIEAEFDSIISSGYKDITLLGQNVNSYLRAETGKSHFPELMQKLSTREGDYLIRFMTSHPKDCSTELLDVMAQSERIAKHLHLPVQSGSTEILSRMNRKYTREHYLGLIEAARSRMPGLSITSDIIVGFPGETNEQFEETLSLIKEVEYTSLYTFIFSARRSTPAWDMPDPISKEEKSERMRRLLSLQEEIAAKRCASCVGTTERVLVEERMQNAREYLSCRTSGNVIVAAPGGDELIGNFCNVEITEARNWTLKGKFIL